MKNGEDVRQALKKKDPVLFFKLESWAHISALKDRRGLSLKDLALLSGVSLERIEKIEDGDIASLEELVQIAHSLNLEITPIHVN